jgi:hypothetical protein
LLVSHFQRRLRSRTREAPADDDSWPSGSSKGGAMLTVVIIIAALEFIGLVYLGEAALRRL